MHVEAKPFQNLHFGDDKPFFEVIERLVKVQHRTVLEGSIRGGPNGMSGSLEQDVVYVDQITHAYGGFFQFRGEVECTHAYVLNHGQHPQLEWMDRPTYAHPKVLH